MFVGKLILKVHPIAAIEEAHDDNVYKPQLLMTLACSCGFDGPTSPLLKLNNFVSQIRRLPRRKRRKRAQPNLKKLRMLRNYPTRLFLLIIDQVCG